MEAELEWGDRTSMDNYADNGGAAGAGIVTFFSFEVSARPVAMSGRFGVEATGGSLGTTTLLFSVADVIAPGTTGWQAALPMPFAEAGEAYSDTLR